MLLAGCSRVNAMICVRNNQRVWNWTNSLRTYKRLEDLRYLTSAFTRVLPRHSPCERQPMRWAIRCCAHSKINGSLGTWPSLGDRPNLKVVKVLFTSSKKVKEVKFHIGDETFKASKVGNHPVSRHHRDAHYFLDVWSGTSAPSKQGDNQNRGQLTRGSKPSRSTRGPAIIPHC